MMKLNNYSDNYKKEYLAYIKKEIKDNSVCNLYDFIKEDNLRKYILNKYKKVNDDFINLFKQYLIEVEDNIDIILVGELEIIIKTIKKIEYENKEFMILLDNKKNKEIYEYIIKEIFNYELYISNTKQKYAYTIIANNGIKVCPYCNLERISSIKEANIRGQLDHFMPKSKYPLLAISLYNLVPCCQNCNTKKSTNELSLNKNLYPFIEGMEKERIFYHRPITIEEFEVEINSDNIRLINNCKLFKLNERYKNDLNDYIESKYKLVKKYSTILKKRKSFLGNECGLISFRELSQYEFNLENIKNKEHQKFENDVIDQITEEFDLE